MAVIEEVTEENEQSITDKIAKQTPSQPAVPDAPKNLKDVSMSSISNLKHPSIKTSNPEINLSWGQTEKLIVIQIDIEGLRHDQVKLEYDEKSLKVNIKSINYSIELQLANTIVKNFCMYSVDPTKLEIKLKKDLHRTSKRNCNWVSLCKDGSTIESSPANHKLESEDSNKLPQKDHASSNVVMDTKSNDIPSAVVEMPTPKITHDWYQTDSQVIVEVRIKGLIEEHVKIVFDTLSLSVTAKLPKSSAANGGEYSLELDLANAIVPEQCMYKILSTKLEIKMKKKEGIRWTALEGDGSSPAAAQSDEKNEGSPKAPNDSVKRKSQKNWNSINKFLDSELEYLKENQDAGDVFSMLYGDADDATKKAMNKSYQESGGTVLSTDWKDIGSRKVERME